MWLPASRLRIDLRGDLLVHRPSERFQFMPGAWRDIPSDPKFSPSNTRSIGHVRREGMSDRCDPRGPKQIVDGKHDDERPILRIESRNSRKDQEPINGSYAHVIAPHHFYDVLVEQDQILGICLLGHGEEGV